MLLTELDSESFLALMAYPGAHLALDMLEEDIARNAPSLQRVLVGRALGLIDGYPGQHISRLADNLLTVIHADTQAKAIVDRKIEQSLSGTGRAAVSAVAIHAQWTKHTGGAPTAARQRLSRLESSLSGDLRTAFEQLAFRYYERELSAFARTGTRPIATLKPRMITELATGNLDLDRLLAAAATQKFDEADAMWNSELEGLLVEVYENLPVAKWPPGEWLQNQLGALLARRHTVITAPGL